MHEILGDTDLHRGRENDDRRRDQGDDSGRRPKVFDGSCLREGGGYG